MVVRLALLLGLLSAGTPAGLAAATADPLAGWSGPLTDSRIEAPDAPAWTAFDSGEPSRLALLLTCEQAGSWLPMLEGLRALGVPVTVTRDWKQAVRHRMVLAYPTISGRCLGAEALAALRAHPYSGGTLVGFEILGGGLATTFGFREAVPGRSRYAVEFLAARPSPRETRIPLGAPDHPELALGTYAYPTAGAEVLARFDSGEPALLHHAVGTGHAFAVGVDIGDLAARGFNNHQQGIARSYVNQYEPAVDVLLHWLKDRYREAEPQAVTLASAPEGRALAVLLTHDLDYLRSLRNAQDYLAFERQAGIRATYFLQTKYVRDWEDAAFLDAEGVALVRALVAGGMELGSHSVAHSRLFARLPLGTGSERFPGYRPRVTGRLACEGCTILGELRVSHYLVEQIAGVAPQSFRAGHLANPQQLPEAMLAAGYRFGSDSTANDQLTHLPVHAHYAHRADLPLPLFEFPVTIEDEEQPPLGERVDAALALAREVIRDEGVFVILIHPDITGHKLRFEREFVAAMREQAWFGTLGEFGRWWSARDQVEVDILHDEGDPSGLGLRLKAPLPIEGLTVVLPPGRRLAVGGVVRACQDGHAILAPLQGDYLLPLLADPAR